MKRTYINPEALIIELGTCKMMAESTDIGNNPVDPGTYDVKETATSGGKDIWDEEW